MNKKSSGSGPENRLAAVGIRCADHVTPLYPQKLALTSPTGGGRSVDIVRSRTKATERGEESVCLSVRPTDRPPAWNTSAPTGQILFVFDIGIFFEKLKSDKSNGYFI